MLEKVNGVFKKTGPTTSVYCYICERCNKEFKHANYSSVNRPVLCAPCVNKLITLPESFSDKGRRVIRKSDTMS